jgi:DNA topoisomerase VI subunit B
MHAFIDGLHDPPTTRHARPLAARIVKELGSGFEEGMPPADVDQSKSIRLTTLLKSVSIFKPPDGSCLSPAGEYNLRLGIMKELHPDVRACLPACYACVPACLPACHVCDTRVCARSPLFPPSPLSHGCPPPLPSPSLLFPSPQYVATVSEPAAAHEGHPFIVEAGVSLGGQALKDGINVYRFANRIPLLFEAGNDVVTQVRTCAFGWVRYQRWVWRGAGQTLEAAAHSLNPALSHHIHGRW